MPEQTPPLVIQQAEADKIIFRGLQHAAGALGAASLVFLGGNSMAAYQSHEAGSPRDVVAEVQMGHITVAEGTQQVEEIREARADADNIRWYGIYGAASITAAGLGFATLTSYRRLKAAEKPASTPEAEASKQPEA